MQMTPGSVLMIPEFALTSYVYSNTHFKFQVLSYWQTTFTEVSPVVELIMRASSTVTPEAFGNE
ncbi:MAG: hypothetical protein NPINA01_23120 [Nitrospinaceae bacterium]|nr:MAG: hypothetical protein NPINA01_23120 [Nitrospinaceae bacterium]